MENAERRVNGIQIRRLPDRAALGPRVPLSLKIASLKKPLCGAPRHSHIGIRIVHSGIGQFDIEVEFGTIARGYESGVVVPQIPAIPGVGGSQADGQFTYLNHYAPAAYR